MDNSPIQGASVYVQRVTGEFANPFRTKSKISQEGFTDSEGVYVSEFAEIHEYRVSVRVKSYQPYSKIFLPHSQEIKDGDIEVLVLPAYVTDENQQ
ncbi:MAG: hypothetical protein JKX70_02975 [Phycisphaerales bacterium]|nr:hypothetical protein [Phycisphaerales bacterium]